MNNKINEILCEIEKVIKGKKDTVSKVLMAILAQGHILIEDVPGVGKTTLALAFSKTLGLDYKRTQFTPDVVPSDIVGYSMYNKEKQSFQYTSGAVMCNLYLADEINRTSSKTQSALLEVMEEGQVTVDGATHEVPKPFTVIATQNPAGGIGTQMLPQAQLDRFLIKLSMGYPDFTNQVEILKDRQVENPLDDIMSVISRNEIIEMQKLVSNVYSADEILEYITRLAEATRESEFIKLGVSPRGAIALNRFSKSYAFVNGRDYVNPEDVRNVFVDVCAHRILLNSRARVEERTNKDILNNILEHTSIITEVKR